MLIETPTPADIPSIVAIHLEVLPGDVLPSLGPAFLTDLYTRAMDSPDQHFAVVRDGDRVAGYCVTSLGPISVAQLLKPRHLAALAKLAVTRPRLMTSAIVQMTKPTVTDWDDAVEMAFMGVDPGMRGGGIGRLLMDDATAAARTAGRSRVVTKTAITRLADSHVRAYGATVTKTYRAGGRTYFVLEWSAT